jgi:uncharacterized glyoxalase superfamily protein PhnB
MTRPRPLGLCSHIFVSDADAAVAFYTDVFGAAELVRHCLPDGRVLFVEMAVGPERLLISQEISEIDALAPTTLGGTSTLLLLEVDDVDAALAGAVEGGATELMPAHDAFWGERYGIVQDPFGHKWALSTRREDLAPAEVAVRVPSGPSAHGWTPRPG